MARLNAPNLSKLQLINVATVAGAPSLKIRRKAALAIAFLASSGFPARESFNGFIAQTYPEMTKKTATARNPP